ncbi:MAG: ABC transporter permease [Desulfuromonadaceae bacterium]|nr:ABC transporter permease [Desulfuromonas sp.]MDY0184269.1 ABC transporter permease [Desulfuromonadaceae bacterium]
MTFMRVRAVARKETIHILRDPRSLGMGIAIPMLLLLLFGYALSLDVDNVPLLVWDQCKSAESRELVSRFAGSEYFTLHGSTDNYRTIEHALDEGEVLMALVIPPDFSSSLEAGRSVAVQALIEGSDANTAEITRGYAQAVIGIFNLHVIQNRAELQGKHGMVGLDAVIDLRARVWYNDNLESRNYIIPGLIAVIMMVIAALLTSLTVAREWETGTMEQLLSTPLKGSELILGKLLPYFGIGLLDMVLAVLMGQFLFEVPLRGSLVLLFAIAAIFLIGALLLGMLISIVAKSQLVASQVAIVLTFLPAFLLSGFMYDIANMPKPVQVLTHLVPARYFVTLLKGIYLKGVGLEILALPALLLTLFAIVMVVLARVKFKKKLF